DELRHELAQGHAATGEELHQCRREHRGDVAGGHHRLAHRAQHVIAAEQAEEVQERPQQRRRLGQRGAQARETAGACGFVDRSCQAQARSRENVGQLSHHPPPARICCAPWPVTTARTSTTTWLWAPGPPAASWPRGSRRIPGCACCCSRPARATGTRSSTCRPACRSWLTART